METSGAPERQQRQHRRPSPEMPSFHSCASLASESASGGRSVAALGRSRTAATAAPAEVCPDTQAHRDVCLKRLARLAHQLGLPAPCRPAEARRTACRALLVKRQEVHLGWCRQLLDAYQQLRLDRDDLAERCAANARSTAKLESRLALRDRQLAEAQQQLGRLHTAAAAASKTLRGRQQNQQKNRQQHQQQQHQQQHKQQDQHKHQEQHKQQNQQQDQHKHQEQRTKSTRAPTPGQQQMAPSSSPQLTQCWGSPQSLNSSTSSSGGGGGGGGGGGASRFYKPPPDIGTLGNSHIPLPVWRQPHQHQHQYEHKSLQSPATASVSDAPDGVGGGGGVNRSTDESGSSVATRGQLHHSTQRHRQRMSPLAQPPSRPLHHQQQQLKQRQSRRSVAASVSCHPGGGPGQSSSSSSSRHKRSRTYDKQASEMFDRWQRLPVIAAPAVSMDGDH